MGWEKWPLGERSKQKLSFRGKKSKNEAIVRKNEKGKGKMEKWRKCLKGL